MSDFDKFIRQYLLTPAAGKRLIAKAFCEIRTVKEALINKTIVIIAGTTNGYIAEELLKVIGNEKEFSKKRFFRGITLPPKFVINETGRLLDESEFAGDVILSSGKWLKGKTLFDVLDDLKNGDIILKGANSVNLESMQAGIYIGHPSAGTIGMALHAVVGRRVELYIPVGLEKRISGDISKIAKNLNSTNASGNRYMPVSGNIVTEIEAIKILTGAEAELVASGGIGGAEGSCWLAVSGTKGQLNNVDELIKTVKEEPNFEL